MFKQNLEENARWRSGGKIKLAVFDIDGTIFRSSLLTELVSRFVERGVFPKRAGSEIEARHGKFTGRVLKGSSWRDKSIVLREFLADTWAAVDFKRSVAVGDTGSDISVLRLVGTPIAFNPNRELAVYAPRKKWQVILERKDVIYELRNPLFFKAEL